MDTLTPDAITPFARQVADALSDMSGSEAVRFVTALHEQDIRAIAARCAAAQDETRRALADSERYHYLVTGVSATAVRETLRASEWFARAQGTSRILRRLGALAEQAEDGTVQAAELQAILETPVAPMPFRPTCLAFHPDHVHKIGHFATADGAVHLAHPFAGWVLVLENPADPPRLHPAFLVDGEVQSAPALHEVRGIQLQSLE